MFYKNIQIFNIKYCLLRVRALGEVGVGLLILQAHGLPWSSVLAIERSPLLLEELTPLLLERTRAEGL